MAGPPVEKANSVRPVSAPALGAQPGFGLTVQRVPGGNGARKS